MNDRTIYVVDQVVLQPGAAKAFVSAYLDEYAPAARQRGLTLDRVTVSPPVWLDDGTNTVTATWSVQGTAAWWRATVAARHDPAPALWWETKSTVIVERSRTMAADVSNVEGLCDV